MTSFTSSTVWVQIAAGKSEKNSHLHHLHAMHGELLAMCFNTKL